MTPIQRLTPEEASVTRIELLACVARCLGEGDAYSAKIVRRLLEQFGGRTLPTLEVKNGEESKG